MKPVKDAIALTLEFADQICSYRNVQFDSWNARHRLNLARIASDVRRSKLVMARVLYRGNVSEIKQSLCVFYSRLEQSASFVDDTPSQSSCSWLHGIHLNFPLTYVFSIHLCIFHSPVYFRFTCVFSIYPYFPSTCTFHSSVFSITCVSSSMQLTHLYFLFTCIVHLPLLVFTCTFHTPVYFPLKL